MNVATEDGLTLTPRAVTRIRELLAKEPDPAERYFRLFVEGGGCAGMQYGMVFDERREGDQITECEGLRVLVDAVSMDYLRGSVVDYADGLNDSGFKITNPNARQSCGCGNSFHA